jgi:hypothetical protein
VADHLETITDWLFKGSAEVGETYMQLPVADKEEPEYRERVYCYELYHRWRSRWIEKVGYSLAGEIDKRKHPIIRGAPKPDFLVHVPGRMDNLLVVEVKPANATPGDVGSDLQKLMYFRTGEPKYRAAYMWIYGMPAQQWGDFKGELARHLSADLKKHVMCVLHEASGSPAHFASWE